MRPQFPNPAVPLPARKQKVGVREEYTEARKRPPREDKREKKMATREEAEEQVRELAEEVGYIDQEVMDRVGARLPEDRRKIERGMKALASLAGHSIKTFVSLLLSPESHARRFS